MLLLGDHFLICPLSLPPSLCLSSRCLPSLVFQLQQVQESTLTHTLRVLHVLHLLLILPRCSFTGTARSICYIEALCTKIWRTNTGLKRYVPNNFSFFCFKMYEGSGYFNCSGCKIRWWQSLPLAMKCVKLILITCLWLILKDQFTLIKKKFLDHFGFSYVSRFLKSYIWNTQQWKSMIQISQNLSK